MNKIILRTLTAVAALYSSDTMAQTDDVRETSLLGFKIGANYSNVYDSEGEAFVASPKFGLATGVFAAIPFGPFLGFHPEILFSQKGFYATGRMLGSEYSLTRTTSFIDVPLFLAIKPSSSLTLLIGPQYSYLTKQKDVFANGPNSYLQEQEFKNEDIHRNLLCFAGGADINMNHTVLGLRAGWDIRKNNGDGSSTVPRYKNVWYQATIGYRIY